MTSRKGEDTIIRIRSLEIGPLATNCYVVHNDDGQAFIVDAGYEYERILDAVQGFNVSHILLTHAHFDHIGGVEEVKKATGATVCVHSNEARWLTDPSLNLSMQSSEYVPWLVEGPEPDTLLHDGDVLELLGEKIEVRHTPGHSPGHVSYVMGDVVFGGDALFYGSIGRTDLPGGDHARLLQSIRTRLLTLSPTTTVLPGHGPATTIGDEARSNPFLTSIDGR